MEPSRSKAKILLFLQLLLMLYSLCSVLSKVAGGTPFMSWQFIFYYAAVVALLGVYAIGWQQVIKRIPLTSAYANRAVAVIWGIIWGVVFFQETITLPKVLGAILVLSGVALFAFADSDDADDEEVGE